MDEDQLLPVVRLTQSKRSASDARLDPPDPVVTDTDRRGEIDASDDPVVELQEVPTEDEAQLSTDTAPPEPDIASTDSIEAAHINNESIENEQSTVQQYDGNEPHQDAEPYTEAINDTSSHTDEPRSSTSSTTSTVTTNIDSPTGSQPDYPRRPGLRKLPQDHKTLEPTQPTVPANSESTRARRSLASKPPSRYCHLAGQTVDLEHQFQEHVFTAADNLTMPYVKLRLSTRMNTRGP